MKAIALLFTATIAATYSFASFAGDNGGGNISCASDSGRTRVEGGAGAPYNGVGDAFLTYSIDGASVYLDGGSAIAPGSHLVPYTVYSHKKSYVVGVRKSTAHGNSVSNSDVFQMRSIPGTMTEVKKDVFQFQAIIPAYSSIDPRKGTDLNRDYVDVFDQDIQVNCELDVTL